MACLYVVCLFIFVTICRRIDHMICIGEKSISYGKPYKMHFLAYFALQGMLVELNTLQKVEDHENHVRLILKNQFSQLFSTWKVLSMRELFISVFLWCPHSVVTRIGSDSWSEGPGFESCVGWLLWCGHIPVVPNWFNKGLVVCITVCGCVHLKDPLESVEKSRGLSPGTRFLSVADMSIIVTKGDVKTSINICLFMLPVTTLLHNALATPLEHDHSKKF